MSYKKVRLCFFAVLAVLVFIPGFIGGQNAIEFRSREAQIHELLDKSDSENKNPPILLKNFIKIAHEKGAPIESVVAREILSALGLDSNNRMLGWHSKYFIWSVLVKVNFSDDEIYKYYCVLSFNGVDYGAENLAQRLFNKSISSLSEEEAATVASILWSPYKYEKNTPALEKQKNHLISRYKQNASESLKER